MSKEKKVNVLIAVAMIAVGLVMAVYSWNILPESVSTQFGVLNTGAPAVPKFVAVLLPFAITTLSAVYSINYRKQALVGLIGYAMNVLFWLSNM